MSATTASEPEERKRLRDYLLNGGMIIYDAGMGSMPFYNSAKEELAAIFPEVPTQRLSADHPVFHSYYDVDQVTYRAGDTLVFGSESKGLPDALLDANEANTLGIPILTDHVRSLNLANAVAIVVYEALRQISKKHCTTSITRVVH